MSHWPFKLGPVESTPPFATNDSVTGDSAAEVPAPGPFPDVPASVPAPRPPAESAFGPDHDVVDAEMVSGNVPRGEVLRAEVVSTGLDPTVAIPPDFPVAGAQPFPSNSAYGWPETTPGTLPADDPSATQPRVDPVRPLYDSSATQPRVDAAAVDESPVTQPRVDAAPVYESPVTQPRVDPAAGGWAFTPAPTVGAAPTALSEQPALPVADPTIAIPAQPYSGVPLTGAPYQAPQFPTYQPGHAQPGYPQPGYPQPGYPQPGYPQPTYQPGYAQPNYPVPAQYAPPAAPPGYPPTPHYPGGFPPPYYLPEPPRRKRRWLLIGGILAGFVVLALCAGVIGYGLPSLLSNSPSTGSTPPVPGSTATAGSGVLSDDQLFQQALDTQGSALLKNDQAGWLAAVDPAAKSAIAVYKRLFHNLTQLHVGLWKPSSSDFVELTAAKQTFSVGVTYCLGSATCTGTRASFKVTAVKRDGKVVFESIATPKPSIFTNQPLPWEVATLTAVVGKRVIVAASSSWSFRLNSALATAEKAAAAADSYAQWGKPAMYVVYLANATEGKTWFDGNLKHVDGVSYTVSPTDIQIVIMMPYAAETSYAGPGGLNTVIQHEMGHVVTLWAASDRSHGHDSFIEGIAEYIAYNGHSTWAKYRNQDTRAYIRSGKWTSKSCYMTKEITSNSVLASSAAYGIGYLTMKYLADKYGQAKMLSFWGDIERNGKTLDSAAKTEFSKPWASVNTSCVAYVRHSVGA
jgi:hypothetical protein